MPPVRFPSPAREEFLEALSFYEAHATGLGAEFLAEVEHAVEGIAAHPDAGAPYEENTRRSLLRRFPFSLIYEVHPNEIVVVAVAYQRRRPGFWRNRPPR